MTVVETTTVTQVIECEDEEQARNMGEYLVSEGEILSWGDKSLEEVIVDVRPVKGYAEVDYDRYDVEQILGE